MNFKGPAHEFHMRLCVMLKGAAMEFPMSFLLVGVIINTWALITASPSFVLDAHTIKDILSLREEISTLCALYNLSIPIKFKSLKMVPAELILDCHALGLKQSILLHKKSTTSKASCTPALGEMQTLFNYLALVRQLMGQMGPTEAEILVDDFNRKSLGCLPDHTIRRPGTGRRLVTNPYRPGARPVSSGVWDDGFDSASTLVDTESPKLPPSNFKAPHPESCRKTRFNPFKSKSKPVASKQARMDLDEGNTPLALSDAPLKMRRKSLFRFIRF